MSDNIYKVLPLEEWNSAKAIGKFCGSGIDIADGFIHFSSGDQLGETLEKHFTGIQGLVLLAVDPDKIESHLKWEPSRGGDLFPHLYADLTVEQVDAVHELPLDADGLHVLPKVL